MPTSLSGALEEAEEAAGRSELPHAETPVLYAPPAALPRLSDSLEYRGMSTTPREGWVDRPGSNMTHRRSEHGSVRTVGGVSIGVGSIGGGNPERRRARPRRATSMTDDGTLIMGDVSADEAAVIGLPSLDSIRSTRSGRTESHARVAAIPLRRRTSSLRWTQHAGDAAGYDGVLVRWSRMPPDQRLSTIDVPLQRIIDFLVGPTARGALVLHYTHLLSPEVGEATPPPVWSPLGPAPPLPPPEDEVLLSQPGELSVEPSPVLTTGIGAALRQRGLLGRSAALCLFLGATTNTIATYTPTYLEAAPSAAPADTVGSFPLPDAVLSWLALVCWFVALFLLAHKLQRGVLAMTIDFFDSWVIAGWTSVSYAALMVNAVQAHDLPTRDIAGAVQYGMQQGLLHVALAWGLISAEALRVSTPSKIVIMALVALHQVFAVIYLGRVDTQDAWGDEMTCLWAVFCATPRTVWVTAQAHIIVYTTKIVVLYLRGREFAIVKPRFARKSRLKADDAFGPHDDSIPTPEGGQLPVNPLANRPSWGRDWGTSHTPHRVSRDLPLHLPAPLPRDSSGSVTDSAASSGLVHRFGRAANARSPSTGSRDTRSRASSESTQTPSPHPYLGQSASPHRIQQSHVSSPASGPVFGLPATDTSGSRLRQHIEEEVIRRSPPPSGEFSAARGSLKSPHARVQSSPLRQGRVASPDIPRLSAGTQSTTTTQQSEV
eukprot:TRINITY_DN19999_c0_g1_i1.p1 TRINITY_DN19999_c0_g1~~TRINITY_DN19999_c0_g1_i1.p1  ORF type:complete len:773 (+),score=169.09 TRINITY_DN19999_c0_g1_i1:172-2319(+)